MAPSEEGLTTLIEYISISGILLLLMVMMMFTVNDVFMEGPANTLAYHAFTDIGNGISTRVVDIYLIAPYDGTIDSKFDIPDDVAGRDYFVKALNTGTDQVIEVRRGDIFSHISIAGIGASKGVVGETTGGGWNRIMYNSKGF
ncbi:MAG: hypothetical protein QHG99_04445 [Methanomicrobiales archaeon]|nr:hypothetical protein [Methanomicrobiales archaeon]